jgi:DNA invertase Pin-like site-specific DNA recombinase
MNTPTLTRAVAIIRVSKQGERTDDRFRSPEDQTRQITALCEREGLTLVDTFEEMDVSGGTPLVRRTGLRRAVEAIEGGRADTLVVAYLDRLVRSTKIQQEIVERVEAVNGSVLLADYGKLTNGKAIQRLTGTMIGAVNEYVRLSIGERSAEGQALALAEGRFPGTLIPGLRRDEHGQVEIDPVTAPAAAEAFRMRAGGATVAAVREHLAEHGIERSHQGVYKMLANRQAVGEFIFGEFVGKVPALIDGPTFDRVQRMVVARGRKSKSDHLLARLGVLRCETCGSRMVLGVQKQQGREYPFYRCGSVRADCAARPAIAAEIAEQIVTNAVCGHLADAEGRASAEQSARQAVHELDTAQADLDAAFRAFAGYEGETAARERLAELRQVRDDAQARVDQLGAGGSAITVNASADWGRLELEERRDIIRATVESAVVAPGRGANRITVRLAGK